jgi:hypothetical protein
MCGPSPLLGTPDDDYVITVIMNLTSRHGADAIAGSGDDDCLGVACLARLRRGSFHPASRTLSTRCLRTWLKASYPAWFLSLFRKGFARATSTPE